MVFRSIIEGGFSPSEFDFDAQAGELKHRDSGSYLFIRRTENDGYLEFELRVGTDPATGGSSASWGELAGMRIPSWMEAIVRFQDTPDLWAELSNETRALHEALDNTTDNASFTPQEQHVIATRLDEIRNEIVERIDMVEVQVAELDTKIEFVKEATTRLGRKDWLLFAMGTFSSDVMSAVFPPELARHVGQHLTSGLGTLLLHGLSALGAG